MEEKEEKLKIARHSLAHVLAKAIKEIYGDVKLTIGPAIADGFYYDIDLKESIKQEDYEKIEKQMKEILNKGEEFKKVVVSKEQALEMFKDNEYKLEIINELPFYDLCSGPHVESTRNLQNHAFKINSVTGAYWRGSEKNKMLQRVYVYAFQDKKLLNAHIANLEEAKKRDHNKIGRELEYFTTVDYIGQGLPIILPKGAKVIQLLQRFVEDEEERRGYLLTKTPFMSKSDLYKISGHWDHYKDNMFILESDKENEVYGLRPMTCPFQYQVFLNRQRSYKDLPMRLNETSSLFRKEASGECHGLIRVRQFTLSEGHIICMPSQLEEEFKECLDIAKYMLTSLGLENDISYRFSKWDKSNKEKYIGSEEEWERVQGIMRDILKDLNVNFYEADGEAAFYGPKLDIQIKNVFGKEDTLITIQIDFQIAEKFNMEYVDADGAKKIPYIIHRSSIGCYERTLAYLLEKYAGALPMWMAPEQVRVMSLTERNNDYVKSIADTLKAYNFRVKEDIRNEKIGFKIREAMSEKVPYLIIVGDEEENNKTISIRGRGNENQTGILLKDFVERLVNEVASRKNK